MKDNYKIEFEIINYENCHYDKDNYYTNKYCIYLTMFDPNQEDAANIYKTYDSDEDMAREMGMSIEDYIFNMAKYGNAQKKPFKELYWDNKSDAQLAINWLESKLVLDKLTQDIKYPEDDNDEWFYYRV